MPLIHKEPPSAASSPRPARLNSADADERWAAARELAGRAEMVGALQAALGAESDARVREAIFWALARTGTAAAVAVVLPYLRLDDADRRTAALDALSAMPEAVSNHTEALLQDTDPDVRILACELARSLPANEATRILSAVLDTDPEPNVCGSAVEVLAEVGDADAAPALDRCADRFPDEAFLRFAIKVAAARIGRPVRG